MGQFDWLSTAAVEDASEEDWRATDGRPEGLAREQMVLPDFITEKIVNTGMFKVTVPGASAARSLMYKIRKAAKTADHGLKVQVADPKRDDGKPVRVGDLSLTDNNRKKTTHGHYNGPITLVFQVTGEVVTGTGQGRGKPAKAQPAKPAEDPAVLAAKADIAVAHAVQKNMPEVTVSSLLFDAEHDAKIEAELGVPDADLIRAVEEDDEATIEQFLRS